MHTESGHFRKDTYDAVSLLRRLGDENATRRWGFQDCELCENSDALIFGLLIAMCTKGASFISSFTIFYLRLQVRHG